MKAACGFAMPNDKCSMTNVTSPSRRQILVEIVLIFAVFAIQGAWPVPDVNEPYYLGKAIHYWNPDWLLGDFFMESSDTHQVFCLAFGWLSLWLSPVSLAWTGRIITWLLLAWAWRRLSFAVVPRAWCSVLTAALFGCMMERCHMAGEWVIGGVEAKPFAYVLVFLGIESLVRDRWNRALIFFGAASAFHVLVGGWAAVAAGIAWLWLRGWGLSQFSRRKQHDLGKSPDRRENGTVPLAPREGDRSMFSADDLPVKSDFSPKNGPVPPPLKSLWPGVVFGMILSLPGLWPSLMLDRGVDAETVRAAHQIYVFERLPHHLTLTGIRIDFITRMVALWAFWLMLGLWSRRCRLPQGWQTCVCYLRALVTGAVVIAWVGVAINAIMLFDQALAADLLRYYWFRLNDVALPMGVALEGVAVLTAMIQTRNHATSERLAGELARRAEANVDTRRASSPAKHCRIFANWLFLAIAVLVAAVHVGGHVMDRLHPSAPRSHRIANFADWRAACAWVAASGEIPPDARFLTPRLAQTFKWYTNRSDVATWKDVPQDAQTLVDWWGRIQAIYATGWPEGPRWYEPLSAAGPEHAAVLGARYGADYLIVERGDPPLGLKKVYENDTYVIYRLRS